MTGGQPVDGPLDVPIVAHQLRAEGVGKIVIVTDEPEKYPTSGAFPAGVEVFHRDRLDHVQREMRETPGVTAIVYDQTCAAEKRRRRKRGLMEDPAKRVFINELVCEGCGDCGTASNCLSVIPAGDRVRAQAGDRPVDLQQGFLLRQRLLPQLRHRAWRRLRRHKPKPGDMPFAAPAGAGAAGLDRALWHPHHRGRRHRGRHHRRAARHGGPSRGQGLLDPRHDRAGAEGRRRLQPCPPRPAPRGYPCRPAGRRRRAAAARLRHRRRRHLRRALQDRPGRDPRGHQHQ